ncbi:MAG: F0F1 ATP synthase subunit delta [Spirochaetaceae bacterium]|jgi:F0F1-type ATP synthase delta subunit|nr:F0F1 ATP synthase subunit delta [Spirochaetaceae bacterium]
MAAIDRIASAYLNFCAKNTNDTKDAINTCDAGLAVLRSAAYCISKIKGGISGTAAAAQFTEFLCKALEKADYKQKQVGVESACAVLYIMIKKGCGKNLPDLIAQIESQSDTQQRIFNISIDCSGEITDQFVESLKTLYTEKLDAKEVRIKTKLIPELVGGYRINFGGRRLDYSLSRKLEQLKDKLKR